LADADVLIVGAGLAGLVAAGSLRAAGAEVALLDKGVGPGGRLATRRIGDGTLDHGAQFFTVRSDEFAGLVDRWCGAGAPIERWSAGFAQADDVRTGPAGTTDAAGDGHPRYAVRGGMNALAKVLARGLDVLAGTRATAVWRRDGRWQVAAVGRDGPVTHHAEALLVTCPVPQALALFDRGATALPLELDAALRGVAYDPTLALLTVLDAPPPLPYPGGVQFDGGPVRWLADNARKPVSAAPAVTVHAAADWSHAWYDAPDADVAATVHGWLSPWLGAARPVASQVKRWRYAQPSRSVAQRALHADVDGGRLAFGGDAFGEAKIEGAARSGLAAAAVVTDAEA
jgi:renalase